MKTRREGSKGDGRQKTIRGGGEGEEEDWKGRKGGEKGGWKEREFEKVWMH